ncbi:MAG: TetR/AcrR family transcriptional regulator [Ramlibacter sp.]|nr:TetR/AcrR family transcriptional regulator [Ramlibacter sp.]
MPRRASSPDLDSRERLLLAGLALAEREGIRALTVRAVAAAAGANLGSFVYHFRTRDAFVGEMIERWYAPVMAQLALAADEGGGPVMALRRVLLQLVCWMGTHQAFLSHLLVDAAAGEAGARHFLGSMDQRHPALILALIRKAQQARELCQDDPMHQMVFLAASAGGPVLMFHLLHRSGMAPPELARALSVLAADPTHIETRIGWALKGLTP